MTEEQRKALEEKIKNMSPEQLAELQKQQCIFCQIIAGKIPSKKLHEDDTSLGILDINPAAKGHILLMPKQHYAIMPQMPDAIITHLFTEAQKLSQLQLRALKATGTNLFVANGPEAGQRAQHFLLHIIPRREGDNLLAVEEKMLDKSYQKSIHASVQPRLYELLGVKLEKATQSIPSPEHSSPNAGEEEQPSAESQPPTSPKSEPKTPSPQPAAKRPSKEDVSLDDIANLFK